MENKKDVYEKRYKKKIREQVIQKEYEEEKQQMISKINKLQKNLDHYRLIAMKSKNFGAYDNNKGMINGIQSNNINNASKSYTINNNINRSGITTRAVNPEENYILVSGNVPGAKKSLVLIKEAVKGGKKETFELVSYEPEITEEVETTEEVTEETPIAEETTEETTVEAINEVKPEEDASAKEEK